MHTLQSLLVVVSMLFGATGAQAQLDDTPVLSSPLLESLDEFRASVRIWSQEEVQPLMAAWKAQFDASLPEDDRMELNALRDGAAQVEAAIHTHLMELRTARDNGDEESVARLEETLAPLVKRRREIIRDAIPFVIGYEQQLRPVTEIARPKMEEWRRERRELWEDWLSYNKHLIRSYGDAQLLKRLDAVYQADDGLDSTMRTRIDATQFVLWDGREAPLAPDVQVDGFAYMTVDGDNDGGFVRVLSVYPNPADDRTTVAFELPDNGSIVMRVHNTQGDVVYMPLNGRLAAGEHTVDIPTSRFTPGRYYYTFQSAGNTHTGAFNIVR